jgi:hypothetical protein
MSQTSISSSSTSSVTVEDVAHVPVALWTSSCIGGHEYAGNAIVYPSGDWLGYQYHQDDAGNLLRFFARPDRESPPIASSTVPPHEGKPWHHPVLPEAEDVAEAFPNVWRGRIGLSKQEQVQVLRPVLERIAASD